MQRQTDERKMFRLQLKKRIFHSLIRTSDKQSKAHIPYYLHVAERQARTYQRAFSESRNQFKSA